MTDGAEVRIHILWTSAKLLNHSTIAVTCKIDRRIGAASGILHSFYRLIVTEKEVSQKTRMAIFNPIYRSTLI